MERAQAELELAIRHVKQVEERVALHRRKIADMRERGLSVDVEEEQLRSLLVALESLKAPPRQRYRPAAFCRLTFAIRRFAVHTSIALV